MNENNQPQSQQTPSESALLSDNELIAEFYGAMLKQGPSPFNSDYIVKQWIIKGNPYNQHRDAEIKYWYSPEQLQYHCSWDWLMPVVEKIESLPEHPLYKKYRFSVSIKNNSCEISFARLSKGEPGHNHYEGKTKIDAVYKSVIDFIKWYNQQKP